ncbi:MAG TPA: hypothetical protein DDY98_03155 [Ruminococcaceae bacterium]|nr:hypothetical protein [Oscillospiraceae bacterium]
MEENEIVIKNKGYRKLCSASFVASVAITAIYIVVGIVNIMLGMCENYPRFVARSALAVAFTIAVCLLARRSFIYMELGGDFALARRSGAIMIILLLVSALVEAYYVSVNLVLVGRGRLVYMAVIALVGAATILPIVLLEYLNFEIYLMRLAGIISFVASLLSFCIGIFVIGLVTIRVNGISNVYQLFAICFDSLAPIYLIQIFPCIMLMDISRLFFVKEMKLNAKLAMSNEEAAEANE